MKSFATECLYNFPPHQSYVPARESRTLFSRENIAWFVNELAALLDLKKVRMTHDAEGVGFYLHARTQPADRCPLMQWLIVSLAC